MSILVVGSIALDDVETPFGKVTNSPGGSVGVVGQDFNLSLLDFLKKRQVNLDGLKIEKGKTFRWGGRYHSNMNLRDTIYTHLNVFENFNPEIPESYRDSQFVFLANIDPELQLEVLRNIHRPRLTVLDTMNFWISSKRQSLDKLIKLVDIIILNDEEICELTGIPSILQAARSLLYQGPKAIVIKKGEHGSVLVTKDDYFIAPAFPVEKVVDPTGAGFLGYLAECKSFNKMDLRRAVIYGTTIASFNVESYSFDKLKVIQRKDIEERVEQLRQMVQF